jgi:AcrR family transcriptional regulator
MASRARVRARGGSAAVARSRPARVEAPRDRVVEIQRSRLLAAALGAIEELSYPRVTVAHIASRARVSRRTFYELFENREDCLLAALESVVETVRGEVARADLAADRSWRERVRTGLWVILSFFEREPVLARVVVVQALRGGPRVLERREEVLAELARVVDEGRNEDAKAGARRALPSVTAEGLVGAAFSIVYGRLLRDETEPLTSLLGELTGLIVLPYRGPAAARREQTRSAPARTQAGKHAASTPEVDDDGGDGGENGGGDPLAGVPMRLTYRTALVLEAIAERPGVSNRAAADLAEISDQGQISKLLTRLERLGLVENLGEGHAKGEPNAWSLTDTGRRIARRLRMGARHETEVVA